MTYSNGCGVEPGFPGALTRPAWEACEALNAGQLRLEQQYRRQRLRRHLRLTHGWGVVCGLNVVAANGGGWDVLVCPGYGIAPCGDEILVAERFRLDLREYLWTRPVGVSGYRLWIALEAIEEPAFVGPAPPAPCGCCNEEREVTVRLRDALRIVISWTPPFEPSGGFDMCGGGAPPLPPCPPSCALVLASVALPPLREPIVQSAIANTGGR